MAYEDFMKMVISSLAKSGQSMTPSSIEVAWAPPSAHATMATDGPLTQLQDGLARRIMFGAGNNAPTIRIPTNSREIQLRGIFGGDSPQRAISQPMLSPGLGTGAPNPQRFEDGSFSYPGQQNDPLLRALTDWINRRFPNET